MQTGNESIFSMLKKVISLIIFPIYIRERKKRRREESRRLARMRFEVFRGWKGGENPENNIVNIK